MRNRLFDYLAKLAKNHIFYGNINVGCGVDNRPISAYKVSKKALLTGVWWS